MNTTLQTQSDYRDLPLDWLVVSPTNPRKTFDEAAMQELAASIRENGVLQPLLEGIAQHYIGASISLAGVRLDPSLPLAA